MTKEFNHHPRLMNEAGWRQLPPSRWHQKFAERYPIGSLTELYRRADDFFYRGLARVHGEEKERSTFLMQPAEELLDAVENPVDIVACTLVDKNDQQAVIILEDHCSGVETSYSFGKSTIMRHLLGLNRIDNLLRNGLDLPDDGIIPARNLFERLAQISAVPDLTEQENGWQILTADITFLARSSADELMVMAMSGTKEDYIWDTARSAMRFLVTGDDPFLPTTQIELARKLQVDQNMWADIGSVFPVKQMIFIAPDNLSSASQGLPEQLKRNPLYLASRAKYWDIDPYQHESLIDRLLNPPLKNLPAIKYLSVGNPLNSSCLQAAAETIGQSI